MEEVLDYLYAGHVDMNLVVLLQASFLSKTLLSDFALMCHVYVCKYDIELLQTDYYPCIALYYWVRSTTGVYHGCTETSCGLEDAFGLLVTEKHHWLLWTLLTDPKHTQLCILDKSNPCQTKIVGCAVSLTQESYKSLVGFLGSSLEAKNMNLKE
ncbi:hypothetical protein OS493_033455 [Desmophyllum pertusum]|uniref:Uncharacterized protein n=1 Tax=Desmophyllum pertusum TaxID=174260 RepID=A0A9W9ZWE8_9CNID|nr:hypothetical protein OS493_033455 [Desmophyllum pertusum]